MPLIAEYSGNDLQPIANELDKLMLLVSAPNAISAQHIEDNLGISKEYNLFELQRHLPSAIALNRLPLHLILPNTPKQLP
ncbi:MAG: hypothetical protein IPL33_09600 [Sphingobacteriales bacterium]|nr:hypothetical protein [Sphingobacteriales bacterium]